jgi:hypothetical protein
MKITGLPKLVPAASIPVNGNILRFNKNQGIKQGNN